MLGLAKSKHTVTPTHRTHTHVKAGGVWKLGVGAKKHGSQTRTGNGMAYSGSSVVLDEQLSQNSPPQR